MTALNPKAIHGNLARLSRRFGVACGLLSLGLVIGAPGVSDRLGGGTLRHAHAAPSFVYPLMGTMVSSKYGIRRHPVTKSKRHHAGIDLAAPAGSPIRAIRAGRVIFADSLGAYGKLVVVDHGDGFVSRYGHCEAIKTAIGSWVKAGTIIATVGQTGRTTGPHLHFEVMLNGEPFDPEKLIPGLAAEAAG
jgi:murein DD-endopeptidase MepM/ murein hydrolase activator NlpD